ncbi:MAG: hypothetical protein LBU61_00760 [Coriobacteriales bacterium]|jgi:hypothetical protein|nr:hypothetical protein [Coriobacteriales bacterium]
MDKVDVQTNVESKTVESSPGMKAFAELCSDVAEVLQYANNKHYTCPYNYLAYTLKK